MEQYIVNGKVFLDGSFQEKTIGVEGGCIRILPKDGALEEGAKVYDAEGKKVVPGFLDIHTHGAVGVDVNAATAEELGKIGHFMATQGTTSWLCSVLTDTKEQTLWCIDEFKKHKKLENDGADLLGIHLEGPFLAKEFKGAMPEHLLRDADVELLKEYQEAAEGNIRYLTVSPEIEGIVDAIPAVRDLGIVVAIGHSGADYDTSMKAIENGAAIRKKRTRYSIFPCTLPQNEISGVRKIADVW